MKSYSFLDFQIFYVYHVYVLESFFYIKGFGVSVRDVNLVDPIHNHLKFNIFNINDMNLCIDKIQI